MKRRNTSLGRAAPVLKPKQPGRHHIRVVVDLPNWIHRADDCLRSVAEDAYTAKALAVSYGATRNPKCEAPWRAAHKSLAIMENPKAKVEARCAEGDRAARKFWEAKACARSGRLP